MSTRNRYEIRKVIVFPPILILMISAMFRYSSKASVIGLLVSLNMLMQTPGSSVDHDTFGVDQLIVPIKEGRHQTPKGKYVAGNCIPCFFLDNSLIGPCSD